MEALNIEYVFWFAVWMSGYAVTITLIMVVDAINGTAQLHKAHNERVAAEARYDDQFKYWTTDKTRAELKASIADR